MDDDTLLERFVNMPTNEADFEIGESGLVIGFHDGLLLRIPFAELERFHWAG